MSRSVEIMQELIEMSADDDARGKLHVALCVAVCSEGKVDVLRTMLTSDDLKIVRDGICVADEVAQRNRPLLDAIVPLLQHDDQCIKFDSVNAILDGASEEDGAYIAQVLPLLKDDGTGIRRAAINFLLRKRASCLRAALKFLECNHPLSEHVEKLRWILNEIEISNDQIIMRLNETDDTWKMYAVAAAGRFAPKFTEAISVAVLSKNDDIQYFAKIIEEMVL